MYASASSIDKNKFTGDIIAEMVFEIENIFNSNTSTRTLIKRNAVKLIRSNDRIE